MTQLFADGADIEAIFALADDPQIEGFTTNPSLMWKAGLTDYREFAARILDRITDRPVSFEVFADDEQGIREQAMKIKGWGENVFVKVPVTTTEGRSLAQLVGSLARDEVQVNVTAVMTLDQVEAICRWLPDGVRSFISIFAGRIADTGIDPYETICDSVRYADSVGSQIIWASPREILNVAQARRANCHAITLSPEQLAKLPLLGKNLKEYSLETVKMFYADAQKAGYQI